MHHIYSAGEFLLHEQLYVHSEKNLCATRMRLAAVSSLLWCFHLIVVKTRKVLFFIKDVTQNTVVNQHVKVYVHM
jgi:hypothetical protein